MLDNLAMKSKMSFIKRLMICLVSLMFVGLLTVSLLWALTVRQRSRAESFLEDFRKVLPGKSSFAEAQAVAQRHGGIPSYTTSDDVRCTSQKCTFRFLFENKPLTSFYLARYTELTGWIFVRDGVVVGRAIDYGRDSGAYSPFQYEVSEAPMWNEAGTVQVEAKVGLWRLKVDPSGIPSIVQVTLNSSSSLDQRTRAYSLDLSCLAKVFGCGSPNSMFPPRIPYRGGPSQTHSDDW